MKTKQYIIILIGVLLLSVAVLFLKFRHSAPTDPELKFTPEQRQVLASMRQARADLDKARSDLVQLINEARQVAITKGMDPNVHTTWLDLQANNQPIVTAPNAQNQQVSVHWGFRDDGLITWKRP